MPNSEDAENPSSDSSVAAEQCFSDLNPVSARNPFFCKVLTVVSVVVSAGFLVALFLVGMNVLLAAFAGVLFAVLLTGFSRFIERHTPLSYGWALGAVVVLITAIISGLMWAVVPRIADQTTQIGQQLTGAASRITAYLQQREWGQWILERAHPDSSENLSQGGPGAGLGLISEWGSYILVALFVGLFAAANPKLYREAISHMFFLRHRERICQLMDELGYTLRWWLIGQGLAMLVIGVSTTILLWLFGLPLAGVIGLLVGLLGFVPYVGPILGALPVALIAATDAPEMLGYIMLAYIAVQMLEGYVVTPLIQRRMVYLPPVFTIIAQVLIGVALGTLGFILATPLAAVILVLTRFYRADILGDPAAAEELHAAQEKREEENKDAD